MIALPPPTKVWLACGISRPPSSTMSILKPGSPMFLPASLITLPPGSMSFSRGTGRLDPQPSPHKSGYAAVLTGLIQLGASARLRFALNPCRRPRFTACSRPKI